MIELMMLIVGGLIGWTACRRWRPSSLPEARMVGAGEYGLEGVPLAHDVVLSPEDDILLEPNVEEVGWDPELKGALDELAEHQARSEKLRSDWHAAGADSGGPIANMIWEERERVIYGAKMLQEKMKRFVDEGRIGFDEMIELLKKAGV